VTNGDPCLEFFSATLSVIHERQGQRAQKVINFYHKEAALVTIQPDIATPIVRAPVQPVDNNTIGYLKWLIGTWNSPKGSAATGYNVMPLPQQGAPEGFVLKNFPYYEEITFAPIAGGAPNRGGTFTQNSNVLFYEQRVFIANNPAPSGAPSPQDTLIHAENGAWLYRTYAQQLDGAYGPAVLPWPTTPPPTQNPATQYAKQVSVPHGNSLLLVGHAEEIQGPPHIPAAPRTVMPFSNPAITDPNSMLTNQLASLEKNGITVQSHIKLDVSNDPALGGGINNLLFEQHHATIDAFQTTWYIEFLSNNTVQLQYFQFIWMKLLINGVLMPFLHSDANTLFPVSGQIDAQIP